MQGGKEIRPAFRALRRGLLVVGLFSLALNLLMLTVPLYMASVYDRVLASASIETLVVLTVVAVGALALAGILESIRQVVLMRLGARLETRLGGPMLDVSLANAQKSGGDLQGLRDLSQLRQFIASPVVCAIFDAPVAPIYLALVFLLHPHLGWLSLGAAVLLVAISLLNQQITKAPLAEAARHGLVALQKARAQARNAEAIRAMGMFGHAVASWGEANAKGMIAADVAGSRNAWLGGLTRFLRLFLQVAVLGWGAYLVLTDKGLTAGIIFAASIISARALAPLDQVIGGWKSFAAAAQAYRRLKAMLAAAPADPERMALPEPSASLAAEKLVYVPAPGAEPILKGLTFAIEPGEVVGVIGPSGAGKSTLARLLVGALRPSSGLVRIGGDDLANWPAEALGPHIGYVPQDVELLPATIAENIARLSPAPDPRKVVAAARLANCHELIQRLPAGYDTLLGTQGHMLSGGQRQRIALARAFYGNPKFVVLDEPNASLDSHGEQALTAALIAARAAGVTCVVVTQRASVMPALTKVMALKDGRIEAYGPRDEVLPKQIRPAAPAPALPGFALPAIPGQAPASPVSGYLSGLAPNQRLEAPAGPGPTATPPTRTGNGVA